jgi:methylated-DNA-protein-cysteine methyltransferase-like protein
MFSHIHAAVLKIPRGKVSTYGAVARAAGFPGAARQVVWALRQGRGLPWHRVVASGGRIALPGAAGLEQRLRLQSEGVRFNGSRVNMSECEHRLAGMKKLNKTTAGKDPKRSGNSKTREEASPLLKSPKRKRPPAGGRGTSG